MKRSNRLVLLIGVFLAALAFVFVIILLSGGNGGTGTGSNASAPPAKVATVIAARDIALGVTVTKDMLTTQTLAPEVRLPGSFGDPSQVVGQVTRAAVKTGQQVTAATFAEQSGANLVVPAGLTGMAVQVDQVSGVGTLIKTGDYVDVIAQISPGSFPLNFFAKGATTLSPEAPKYDPASVKVVIQGVQVISTLLPPPPAAQTGTATPAPTNAGTALNGQQEIVIVAVTTQQAEVIRFAQVDGNITLTLRSPADFFDATGNPIVPKTVVTSGVVLKTMIDTYGVLPPLWIIVPAPSPLP